MFALGCLPRISACERSQWPRTAHSRALKQGTTEQQPSGEHIGWISRQCRAAPQNPGPGIARCRFVCPICLTTEFESVGPRPVQLCCSRCNREFPNETPSGYIDLTVAAGKAPKVYQQRFAPGTQIFRSPLVTFVYERGWRQNFAWAGFPGADVEFRYAMDYLQPAYGGTLLDVSCGSGLFSRRFLKSRKFGAVIASDFSEGECPLGASVGAKDP